MNIKKEYVSSNLMLGAFLLTEGFIHSSTKDYGLKKGLVYIDSQELQKVVALFFSGGVAPAQYLFECYFKIVNEVKGINKNGGLWK